MLPEREKEQPASRIERKDDEHPSAKGVKLMTTYSKRGERCTPSNHPGDLIDARTVASMMGLSYGSFRSYRVWGRPTPPPLFKRAKNHWWSRSRVEAWIADHASADFEG